MKIKGPQPGMTYGGTVKEGLIQSRDIFNLLANLYCVCSSRFSSIYSLMSEEYYRERFRNYFHTFKQELFECISKDIFSTNFQKISGVLKKVSNSTEAEYFVVIWAYLRAIDWMIYNSTVYLNTMKPIWCKTSDVFEPKKYRLLLKPRDLIFNSIKNRLPNEKLKPNRNFGRRIEEQLQKIILYEELPDRRIAFKSVDKRVNELLADQGENLAIAVAPICCDFDYSFKRFKSFEGVPFIFDEIKNLKEITGIIDSRLQECIEKDVHIVVFPELTVNETLREYISNWLKTRNQAQRIIMVIAGSYHILKNKREEKYENSCIVYRFDGQELWEQKKMNRFHLGEDEIREVRSFGAKGFQDFKKLFRETDRKGWGKIETSDTLVLYDSPIGRMAVTIGLDFFMKESHKTKLLFQPHVSIVFIPTMSSSFKKKGISESEPGYSGIASIFCANNCWIGTGGEKGNFKFEDAGFIYIPYKNGFKQLNCNESGGCERCGLKVFRVSQIL